MRIVIDMQGAQTGSRFRGIGRYTMALAAAMVELRGEHEVILALNGLFPETIDSIRDVFDGLLPQENIKVWNSIGPVHAFDPSNEFRKDIAELIREEFLASLEPDIVHVTSLMEGFGDDAVHSIGRAPFKVPTAVTFYDLIPLIKSDVYFAPNPGFERLYREKISHLNRAELMLAISESSREEALQYLDLSREQIVNISAAVDDIFKPVTYSESSTRKLNDKYGVRDKYIMYSGATDDRKNHMGLISAYALLPNRVREEYQLVLVGGLPDDHRYRFEQHVLKSKLSFEDVIITGRVSDEELVQFYNQCALYVFPSLHEGFGLPVLEAMACGAAAIGSSTTSVPEVIGNKEALFDPYSEQAIADKILQVLGDPLFLQSLKENGVVQARSFTWENSAQLTIRAFERWYELNAKQAGKYKEFSNEADRRCWLLDEVARLGPVMSDTEIRRISQAIASNTPAPMKQLLVDVSGLVNSNGCTGVSYIVRRILLELVANPLLGYVVKPVYATADDFGYRYTNKYLNEFDSSSSNLEGGYIDVFQGDIFLGLDVQHNVQAKQASYYQYLRRIGVSIYFVLYELEPLLKSSVFPENVLSTGLGRLALSRYMDGVFCISKTVSLELTSWLEVNAPPKSRALKIGYFNLGSDTENIAANECMTSSDEEILQKISTNTSFLKTLNNDSAKAVVQTLNAFKLLRNEGDSALLILVSRIGQSTDEAISKEISDSGCDCIWLRNVSDEFYSKIQAASTCLIVTSEGERFGMELMEAARCNLPVIARDIFLHREIAGDQAFYFSGYEPEALMLALKSWKELYAQGQHPISGNMPLQTWRESAEQLKGLIN
ncbi:glycosyltransferase [Pseudomonas fluorescens group sp. PF-1]